MCCLVTLNTIPIIVDPCGQADSSNLFEPMARYENCSYDTNSANLCDRYISPQWYRVDDTMLTHCPSLLSCGTLYPVWLNGRLFLLVVVNGVLSDKGTFFRLFVLIFRDIARCKWRLCDQDSLQSRVQWLLLTWILHSDQKLWVILCLLSRGPRLMSGEVLLW